uniref:Auxin efflux carrier component n=1 Tax=Ananas comosus var. bracteatus TaxID=296719 RepID=A0A6V7P7L3_ANACO|nr:unnamed protein product [Ananas comosus var. bracteatus]
MITVSDFYHVMTAVVPLYVAMILAYGSVKWWKIFSPDQCSGINRFVALFAVPLLSFHFISTNNPYTMNVKFIAADTLQKLMVLAALTAWSHLSRRGCLEWTITLFSLSTLPNTLVMGIPLLKGMYGEFSGSLMVQIVVLQCIIWYTLMLFMFEFRGARLLITEQFPDTAGSIASIVVDSDVVSLDGRRDAIETEAEVKEDGKIHVTVRRSNASRSDIYSRRSMGFSSTTPRPSNLTNAEIYSLQSSRNPTPRGSSFNHTDFYSMVGRSSNFAAADAYAVRGGAASTPRPSNYEDDAAAGAARSRTTHYPAPNPTVFSPAGAAAAAAAAPPRTGSGAAAAAPVGVKKANGLRTEDGGTKDLHMFVWSSSASPVSDVFGNNPDYGLAAAAANDPAAVKEVRLAVSPGKRGDEYVEREDFSFGNRGMMERDEGGGGDEKTHDATAGRAGAARGDGDAADERHDAADPDHGLAQAHPQPQHLLQPHRHHLGPHACHCLGLHLHTVGCGPRNGYVQPRAVHGAAAAGHSMRQPRRDICHGRPVPRRPAVMAATSIAVGLRGNLLHVAVVQAALPQGIVPFVFAKEYNVHPDILSTAVIFGMLIALPITLVYYILLGL